MELGTIVVLGLALVLIAFTLFHMSKEKNRQTNNSSAEQSETNRGINRRSKSLPLYRRICRALKYILSSRLLYAAEVMTEYQLDSSEMEIRFYVPRKLIYLDISLPKSINPAVQHVKFFAETKCHSEVYAIEYRDAGEHVKIRVSPYEIELLDRIILGFNKINEHFDFEGHVYVVDEEYPDWIIAEQAISLHNSGKPDEALKKYLEYCNFCSRNPYILNVISKLYDELGNPEKGQRYALRTAVNGLDESGIDYYRSIADATWSSGTEQIENLQKDCLNWPLEKHHGIVILEKEQNFHLGLDGHYLKKCHEILEIRRPVAARMLTRLDFDFSRQKERLIYTNCRIISADNKIQKLPLEQFVVGDSTERNIYITIEDEKTGSWILPDLSAGDIIEWSYHFLCTESYPLDNDKPHFMVVTNLNHTSYPTFNSIVTFRAPVDWPLKFSFVNEPSNLSKSESIKDDYRVTSITLKEYIPIRNTGFYYENYFRNPTVACSTVGHQWGSVAKAILKRNIGDTNLDDGLPSPLAEMLGDCRTSGEALQKAFYWIRDKLKYASVGSALEYIGKPGRARAIIKSGIADCKDKSYLLYQVCKNLGLKAEFVAISSKYGMIFTDLPSDQFDHVFLRVLLDDKWCYLDAAGRYAVFDSAPPIYQGLKILVIGDEGSIESVEVDSSGKNSISITEYFDKIDADWLSGTFHLLAEGNTARLIDENWKWLSLQADNQSQSAQTALRNFLPTIMLISYDRISHTSYSNAFEVLGMHHRCQLSSLGNRRVGTLSWDNPIIPIGYWKNFNIDKLFAFYIPIRIEINIILSDDLLKSIEEFSMVSLLRNEICEINEKTTRNDDKITISREIVIKKKFVDENDIHLVPITMESIEKAFHLAFIFR